MLRLIYARRWIVGCLSVFIIVTVPAVTALASNFGSGTYGSCQYNSCSISISSNTTVNLNVVPTGSGSCTVQSDDVAVLTDNSNGYSLTLSDNFTNTALTNGGNSIAASSGSFASPATLSADKWGYRVDGASGSGFGSGPTSAQSNVGLSSLSGILFAGPPASNLTADTLATTSAAADPAVHTTVWYGLCADTSQPSGTYSSQILYSAVTN